MESYLINKRGDASNWSCSPRFVFSSRICQDISKSYRCKTTGAALKLFLRFAIAKGVITYGLELMMAVFEIVQGIISKIMTTSGLGSLSKTKLPSEMIKAIEDCGFFESIPLSTFAGQPTQNVGKSFVKSYAAACLEGAIIVLVCVIFSMFASTPPVVDANAAPVAMVWKYIGELVFNMLVLVASVKMSVRIVREMMGL